MTVIDRTAHEAPVRDLVAAGDLTRAATAAIELYGGEIASFLHAIARDEDLATEAYAVTCEDLWRGLPGFRWGSSLRTWLYALARNALFRLRRAPRRRERAYVPLDLAKEVFDRAEQIRTGTVEFMRTEVKDEVRRLREALDPDDHELLILRIDRKMSWREVAQAMPGDGEESVDRRAAVLRKRFERAKTLLRTLAAERGIIGAE
ncbi:MAG: sigma-70 family RNA polymerase sigma factor [Myxococcales bacterium]|nr:sigma-70 family RNA polymerase sigma factor [Myxococcales bacterium]